MVHLGVDMDPSTLPGRGPELLLRHLRHRRRRSAHPARPTYHEGKDGFLIYILSLHSPNMAPPGQHAITVYTIAPNKIEGGWEARRQEMTDKLLHEAEKIIPGLREHAKVIVSLTPEDFGKLTQMPDHHSFGGFRPVMGKTGAPHRTPFEGLWFIGAQSDVAGRRAHGWCERCHAGRPQSPQHDPLRTLRTFPGRGGYKLMTARTPLDRLSDLPRWHARSSCWRWPLVAVAAEVKTRGTRAHHRPPPERLRRPLPTAPVEITMWHAEVASNLDTLQKLVRRYNSSQNEVRVKLAFQGSDEELMTKLVASLHGGELPNVIHVAEFHTQRLIDSGAVTPVQEFVDRENYDLSDINEKLVKYYTVGGKLWAMPFVCVDQHALLQQDHVSRGGARP